MPEKTNSTSSSGNAESSGSDRIKTRNGTMDVHVLDKTEALAEKTKAAAIRSKQNTQRVLNEDYTNETNYAQDRAGEGAEQTARDTVNTVRSGDRKIKDETRKQVEKRLEKKLDAKEGGDASSRTVEQGRIRTRDQTRVRNIKTREAARGNREAVKTTARSSGKATVKTAEHSVKGVQKTVKTAQSTSKAAVKTTKAAAKATKEGAQAAAKASERAAIAAKKAAVATGKAIVTAAKAIAAAVKAAAAALWKFAAAIGAAIVGAAPVIILGCVIIAVAVLCTGDTARNSAGVNTTSVITEINTAWQEQLSAITSLSDDVTIDGGRATWPQVFSLYTAKSDETSVDDWDEKNDLSRIFWDMNWISYDLYAVAKAEKVPEVDVKIMMRSVDVTFLYFNDGTVWKTETETYLNEQKAEDIAKEYPGRKMRTALTVTVQHRSVEEMMERLGFTKSQMEHAEALLEKEFASFWQERIYGVVGANDDIVNVAITQLGNSGGWPYWEYCGWPSRVEWCACFITWCGEQCGYVRSNLLPMTSSPWVQMEFFKEKGQWMAGGTEPSPGMIVFYDYYGNGMPDHVGIIERVEGNTVYSIEGNWGDSVQRVTRILGDPEVLGYGWIVD